MLPKAKSEDLLYIEDEFAGVGGVFVYSYPGGKHVGTLPGVVADTMCTDDQGDVFMTNYGAQEIVEYAHGGSNPIAFLSDAPYYPDGCSIDPTTGNLAVANIRGPGLRGFGSVAIFANAKGAPTFYSDPNIYWYYYCGYDNNGNLFVDGNNESTPPVAELPHGSSTFTDLTLSEGLSDAGPIQWDGHDLAIGYANYSASAIYQVTVSGPNGTVIGTTTLQLRGPHPSGAPFWIQGRTIIAPYARSRLVNYRQVGFWHYPAGGAAFKQIRPQSGKTNFTSEVVSVAPSR
jgi:hypothetical protein